MTQRYYSDEERTEALAMIEAGNTITATAATLGIPFSTLQQWSQNAREAAGQPVASYNHAELWANANARAARLIAKQLDKYEADDRDLSPRDLQSVAIVGGIAVDKHLDYRDGRTKGVAGPAVTLNMQITPEQARAMLASQVDQPPAIDAPQVRELPNDITTK